MILLGERHLQWHPLEGLCYNNVFTRIGFIPFFLALLVRNSREVPWSASWFRREVATGKNKNKTDQESFMTFLQNDSVNISCRVWEPYHIDHLHLLEGIRWSSSSERRRSLRASSSAAAFVYKVLPARNGILLLVLDMKVQETSSCYLHR